MTVAFASSQVVNYLEHQFSKRSFSIKLIKLPAKDGELCSELWRMEQAAAGAA